ncbi:putative peptidase M22 [Desulfamplus magnetovallimortis]|uniref:Putative peptidase M22 n=1 Tax=Desulfamplus magnetovallimortis TaxID=1246637 RepID=A0A1W1HKT5_9BACT|nr:tRNA (adenosine(37)-N6)-threonylcarbamoyltransferase complex dimerization subunit type 1 TsaB [Desulfamplus magnetovallimortis]SLM32958.1 putative peptidase M22 [Desulfamplus magnetovallimortis]
MKILAVDTAEQSCSIALVEDGFPLFETFLCNKVTHSRSLMSMIAKMFDSNIAGKGQGIKDVDGMVAACGPGSFTGLRIGISVVKGLACAASKPVAGISSLDGIAWQFSASASIVSPSMVGKNSLSEVPEAPSMSGKNSLSEVAEAPSMAGKNFLSVVAEAPSMAGKNFLSGVSEAPSRVTDSYASVCAMMDAKRGEVYCAFYRFINGQLIEKSQERALAPEKAAAMAGNNLTLFAGSGAVVFRETIKKICGDNAMFAPPFQNYVRASALAYALLQKPYRLSLEHDAIMPVYLRRSDAEMNYEQSKGGFVDKESSL